MAEMVNVHLALCLLAMNCAASAAIDSCAGSCNPLVRFCV